MHGARVRPAVCHHAWKLSRSPSGWRRWFAALSTVSQLQPARLMPSSASSALQLLPIQRLKVSRSLTSDRPSGRLRPCIQLVTALGSTCTARARASWLRSAVTSQVRSALPKPL